MTAITFDRDKFRELIRFFAEQSEDDPHFGATKLNKLLYFTDFKAFGILGQPVTGATYVRLERGPVPREMLPALREMEDAGQIERFERKHFNHTQKRIRTLSPPDLAVFTKDEIELARLVLEELRTLSAAEVSDLSHLEIGWQVAKNSETISYAMAFVSKDRPNAVAVEQYFLEERDSGRRAAYFGQ